MPFLFDGHAASENVANPRGRRIFNKSGCESTEEIKVSIGLTTMAF